PALAARAFCHSPASGIARTAKPDMRGAAFHGLRLPRGRPVAVAIVVRAQVRTTLEYLAAEARGILPCLAAAGLVPAMRIAGHAAGLRGLRRAVRRQCIPVRRPLPHIADHVEQAE